MCPFEKWLGFCPFGALRWLKSALRRTHKEKSRGHCDGLPLAIDGRVH